MTKLYDFNDVSDIPFINIKDDLVSTFERTIDKIFEDGSETKIAVVVKTICEGCIEKEEVYIYKNYMSALDIINSNEYKQNVSVEVAEISRSSYAHMLYKYFDGSNYGRLACPSITDYEPLTIVRKFYDTCTVVYSA